MFRLKKRRIAYLVILGLIGYYDLPNRFYKWITDWRYSLETSYTRRWARHYHPDGMLALYQAGRLKYPNTVNDFTINPADVKLSQESVELISMKMLKIDAKLTHGFSRELMTKAIQSNKMTELHGKLGEVEVEVKEGEEVKKVTQMQVQPLMTMK